MIESIPLIKGLCIKKWGIGSSFNLGRSACNSVGKRLFKPFNDQCSHHIETSQLICSANQLISFYMMGTLVVKGLNSASPKVSSATGKYIFKFNHKSERLMWKIKSKSKKLMFWMLQPVFTCSKSTIEKSN